MSEDSDDSMVTVRCVVTVHSSHLCMYVCMYAPTQQPHDLVADKLVTWKYVSSRSVHVTASTSTTPSPIASQSLLQLDERGISRPCHSVCYSCSRQVLARVSVFRRSLTGTPVCPLHVLQRSCPSKPLSSVPRCHGNQCPRLQ